ncbi:hypothetical protein GALL_19020 [mine drainage metagenome]|uniref:Uncharacterized protein n=1 Tax=mine drainage metagenome TaxID=410659 RepID=A0A1J5TA09_9ZZZZ
MNTHIIYTLSVMTLLAGCASNPAEEQAKAIKQMEYKMQVYGPACEKLGFKNNTDLWRECIQKEYGQSITPQWYPRNYPYWDPYYGSPYYYRYY